MSLCTPSSIFKDYPMEPSENFINFILSDNEISRNFYKLVTYFLTELFLLNNIIKLMIQLIQGLADSVGLPLDLFKTVVALLTSLLIS